MTVPLLILDSRAGPGTRDPWTPVPVETALGCAGVAPKDFMNGNYPARSLDYPPNLQQPNAPAVCYQRVKLGDPLTWDQYWFHYLYNPKRYLGTGQHEGDWELIQIGYSKHDTARTDPVAVTFSQHDRGQAVNAWDCHWTENRLVAYVGWGSHANYPRPVRGAGHQDYTDGRGPAIDCEPRPFGPWAHWPGRWGNSTRSPRSPACQKTRWDAPHQWHTLAGRAHR